MPTVLDWLLEVDESNPSLRYLTLTELLDRPSNDPEVIAAGRAVMRSGAVPAILDAQSPGGYWQKPGEGYYPKYRGTVWSMIYLAQLGADPADPRVRAGAEHLLEHAIATTGAFSATGRPAGSIYCHAGNLAASLLDHGFAGDERLQLAVEMLARYTTGQGMAPAEEKKAPRRYFRSGACGPGFRCSANDRLPCAWGAVKVLRGLARVPATGRTALIEDALRTAVDLIFSVDPSTADYPAGYSDKPSRSWFRFGFPVFYVTDVLQIAEALSEVGFGADPRLKATHDLLLSKQDDSGRWRMEYSYAGKTWADVEERGKPSKWVTLRALRVLKAGGHKL